MIHIRRLSHPRHARSETDAFERAVHRALRPGGPPPLVPSCPGWSVSHLVGHLGGGHRYVGHILRGHLTEEPDARDLTRYGLPAHRQVLAARPQPTGRRTAPPSPAR
ncbi:maleylpyruvate isomerase N-terminal domain-containing protein [Streptomyces sp. NPDC055254]